jgi:hypothetical protein
VDPPPLAATGVDGARGVEGDEGVQAAGAEVGVGADEDAAAQMREARLSLASEGVGTTWRPSGGEVRELGAANDWDRGRGAVAWQGAAA